MKYLVLNLVKLYQRSVSRILNLIRPNCGCRFYPSCSVYFSQAVEKYGIFRGGIKGMWRIFRCNPFNRGGEDILK